MDSQNPDVGGKKTAMEALGIMSKWAKFGGNNLNTYARLFDGKLGVSFIIDCSRRQTLIFV